MKTLIAYYSRAGENYFNGAIRRIDKGNTEIIAEKLQELTGAELFQIQQKNPYSDHYQECVNQSSEDLKNNARPELTALPDADFDLLYLGEHVIIGLSQSDLQETESRIDLVLISSGGEIKAPISSPI